MNFLSYIWKDTMRRKSELVLIILGISFGVAGVFVLFSLRIGISQTLFNAAESKNPLTQITVYPKNSGTIFSLLPGANRMSSLTPADIEKIRTVPHVVSIDPEAVYQGFSSVELNLAGQQFRSDALIFGVPREIIKDDLPAAEEWSDRSGIIPVVISKRLLDLYNLSLAPQAGTPEISANFLIGTRIKIYPGSASFLNQMGTRSALDGKIVGFSDRVDLVGVTIPLSAVEKLNLSKNTSYNKLFITVDSARSVAEASTAIESAGFKVSSIQTEFSAVGKSIGYISIILIIVTIIIVAISMLLIGSVIWSSLNARKKELGILRAIGGSNRVILSLITFQSIMYGIIGCVPGLVLGSLITTSFKYYLSGSWAFYSISPDALFAQNEYLVGALFASAIFITALASLVPTIKILKKSPRNLIST